jgi:hypothetical protein
MTDLSLLAVDLLYDECCLSSDVATSRAAEVVDQIIEMVLLRDLEVTSLLVVRRTCHSSSQFPFSRHNRLGAGSRSELSLRLSNSSSSFFSPPSSLASAERRDVSSHLHYLSTGFPRLVFTNSDKKVVDGVNRSRSL